MTCEEGLDVHFLFFLFKELFVLFRFCFLFQFSVCTFRDICSSFFFLLFLIDVCLWLTSVLWEYNYLRVRYSPFCVSSAYAFVCVFSLSIAFSCSIFLLTQKDKKTKTYMFSICFIAFHPCRFCLASSLCVLRVYCFSKSRVCLSNLTSVMPPLIDPHSYTWYSGYYGLDFGRKPFFGAQRSDDGRPFLWRLIAQSR